MKTIKITDELLLSIACDYDLMSMILHQGEIEKGKRIIEERFPGLTLEEAVHDETTGLDALVLVDSLGKNYIVYEGSQSKKDWEANIENGGGEVPKQYVDALELAERYEATLDAVVGNSLGGGIAQFVAVNLVKDVQARTMNASAINTKMKIYRGLNKEKVDVKNFHTNTDILTRLLAIERDEQAIKGMFYIGEHFFLPESGSFQIKTIGTEHSRTRQMVANTLFHPLTGEYIELHSVYHRDEARNIYRVLSQVKIDVDNIAAYEQGFTRKVEWHLQKVEQATRRVNTILKESSHENASRENTLIDEIDTFVFQIFGKETMLIKVFYDEHTLLNFLFGIAQLPSVLSPLQAKIVQFLKSKVDIRKKIKTTIETFEKTCASFYAKKIRKERIFFSESDADLEAYFSAYLKEQQRQTKEASRYIEKYVAYFKLLRKNWVITDDLEKQATSPMRSYQENVLLQSQQYFDDFLAVAEKNNQLLRVKKEVAEEHLVIFERFLYKMLKMLKEDIVVPIRVIITGMTNTLLVSMQTSSENWIDKYYSPDMQMTLLEDYQQYGEEVSREAHKKSYDELMVLKEKIDNVYRILNNLGKEEVHQLMEALSPFILQVLITDESLRMIITEMQLERSNMYHLLGFITTANADLSASQEGGSIQACLDFGLKVQAVLETCYMQLSHFAY